MTSKDSSERSDASDVGTEGIVRWPIPEAQRDDMEFAQTDALVRRHAEAGLNKILDVYVLYPDKASADRDFDNLFRNLDGFEFAGRGIEIGAGVAVFSACVCRHYPRVENVHAIEIVSSVVERLRPIVLGRFLEKGREKVIDVVGSFDDIHLEDEAYDFCIENSSLHHSDDLLHTLREVHRKLKPGGHLLIVDRAHNDVMSDRQKDMMLDLVYSRETMERYGFFGANLTRRQNGEHEIRLGEWRQAISDAGFAIVRHFEMRTHDWRKLLNALIRLIPFWLRERFGWLPTRVRPHPGEVGWLVCCLLGGGGDDPMFKKGDRDLSVFLVQKPSRPR